MLKKRMFKLFLVVFALSSCEKDNSLFIDSYKEIDFAGIYETNPSHGFTCTGLGFNSDNNTFLVGNIGAYKPGDAIVSSIEVFDSSFNNHISSVDLSKLSKNNFDVQGIAYDSADGTIWFCSFSENLIYNISLTGSYIFSFSVKEPTGIAYDSSADCLYVLTYTKLLKVGKNGIVLSSMNFKVKGQDQLYFESPTKIYVTAGLNYHKQNYVYLLNFETKKYEKLYTLNDSYAIEGIFILESNMYILNDGYFHSAKDERNVIKVYSI